MQSRQVVIIGVSVFATTLLLSVALAGIVEPVWAQSGAEGGRMTVWDGVYTPEEAARGQGVFERNCAACHAGEDGRSPSAAFTGPAFMERWREYNLRSLFGTIRDTMPRDEPASLSDAEYLDIVARLLEVNAFPAGDQELNIDTIASIQIEGQGGPQALPSGSLAQVVGCLTEGDGGAWMLTNAAEPARTDRARGSTEEELAAAEAKPLGAHSFQVSGFSSIRGGFSPETFRDQKMQVKGYVFWLPESQRLDPLSMEMIAATCN